MYSYIRNVFIFMFHSSFCSSCVQILTPMFVCLNTRLLFIVLYRTRAETCHKGKWWCVAHFSKKKKTVISFLLSLCLHSVSFFVPGWLWLWVRPKQVEFKDVVENIFVWKKGKFDELLTGLSEFSSLWDCGLIATLHKSLCRYLCYIISACLGMPCS